MTDDAAFRIRAAAKQLRTLADAATPGPWRRPLNTRYKATVTAPLPDGERGEWLDGNNPLTGQRERCTVVAANFRSDGKHSSKRSGRDLEYIAALHPTVGRALADWLASAAEDAEQVGPDHRALAVADALLNAPKEPTS